MGSEESRKNWRIVLFYFLFIGPEAAAAAAAVTERLFLIFLIYSIYSACENTGI